LPDANQAKRFLQGDTVAGQTKEAGLPNITGGAGGIDWANSGTLIQGAHGAIAASNPITNCCNTVNAPVTLISGNHGFNFDASSSNPIYGNSTTVQPDALTTRYIIKAFDGQTADSALINITQYANELAGKADRSLSNLTDAGKSFSFPSDTYIALDVNLTSYTAPADGYLCAGIGSSINTNVAAYVTLGNMTSKRGTFAYHSVVDAGLGFWTSLPVRKGETVTIGRENNTLTMLRFVYAQGEV
jgi:hypothetical protein